MGTRSDFQRLLEDMDKVIQQKRQELSELDARLETTRNELIEKESKELVEEAAKEQQDEDEESSLPANDESLSKQKDFYEQILAQQREEISELEYINQELAQENDKLSEELAKLTAANEKLKANTYVLKESIEELKSANFELNMQLARANSESKMQQKLLKKCHEQDQVLMDAFNDKLESLRKAIAKRDAEIDRLRSESKITLESLGIMRASLDPLDFDREDDPKRFSAGDNLVDSDSKQRIIDIVAIVEEKNAQIEMLKQQLLQATKDIEKDAALLENLTKYGNSAELRRDFSAETNDDEDKAQLLNRCKMLEDELKLKDNHVHLVEFRNRNFEVVIPTRLMELIQTLYSQTPEDRESADLLRSIAESLREAITNIGSTQNLLDEIERLRREEQSKKRHIEQLVRELNDLDPEAKPLAVTPATISSKISTSKKAKKVHFENDPEAKEPEEDMGNHERETEATKPDDRDQSNEADIPNANTRENPEDTRQEVSRSAPSTKKSVRIRKYHSFNDTMSVERSPKFIAVQNRVKQLEDENELLELAMKEILLSIKWSDARCGTILIDCPSLERLCQLIEARFLTLADRSDNERELEGPEGAGTVKSSTYRGEMFQMIVLKSELDLVRGQNEQLRVDMKLQKRDQQEMLARLVGDQVSMRQESQKVDICDAECQTESSLPLEPDDQNTSNSKKDNNDKIEAVLNNSEPNRCKNCQRLVALANHLLECIVRIECKVTMSDETYMVRLITLYQFTQRLAQDLDMQENLLNESRREYHTAVQQKLKVEARLMAVEAQMNAHIFRCPMLVSDISSNRLHESGRDITAISGSQANIFGSQEAKRSTSQGFTPDTGMTISLLQSIIGCLQARLEYKDERLKQLEHRYFHESPQASAPSDTQPSREITLSKTSG